MIGYWMFYTNQRVYTIWDSMLKSHPGLKVIQESIPEYWEPWNRAIQHADSYTYNILHVQTHKHTEYQIQQIRDVWQMALSLWDEMACAPNAVFLQQEIAEGSRWQQAYVNRILEFHSDIHGKHMKYRTHWIGTGQPNDPYDSKLPSLLV